MSDHEKSVEETTEDKNDEQVEESLEEEATEAPEESVEDSDEEYQEELDKIKQATKNSEAAKLRVSRKEAKEEAEANGLTPEEVEKLLEEKTAELRMAFESSRRSDLISRYTHSKAAQELIEYHLENTIKPSGNLEDDVRNAVALANRKKIEESLQEVKRSTEAKEAVSSYSAGGRKESGKKELPLSEADKKFMKVFGLSKEKVEKALNKK